MASANLASIGLVAADITALNLLRTPFTTGLDSVATTKQAAKAAVTAKDTEKDAYLVKLRELANKVLGTPNVPLNIVNQLGLNPPHTQPTKKTPTVPTNLLATPYAIGVNALDWKANGNIAGTQYLVDFSRNGSDWEIAGTTTATKYSHTGQTPGQAMWYRVTAQRRNIQSDASLTAAVYLPTPSMFIEESQAA